MEDKIEEIARAMVKAQFSEWDQLDGGDHGYWCEMARAAYEVMTRSDGQVDALWLRNLPACHPPYDGWTDADRANLERIAGYLTQSSVQTD